MRARRLATLVAAIALAVGLQAEVVHADAGTAGTSSSTTNGNGNGNGNGGGGGPATGPGGSPCAAPGMTTVPALGPAVSLGLPFDVDPSTQQVTLQSAAICVDASDGSGQTVQQAVVVPLPDLQGADFSQSKHCSQAAAAVSLQCTAQLQPVIAWSDPRDGADAIGLVVSLPLTLCVDGACHSAGGDAGTVVLSGMLQCSGGTSVATSGGHLICTWQGAEASVDGIPQPAPDGAGTGTASAGAWNDNSVTPGLFTMSNDCSAADPASCGVTLENPYLAARLGGGRLLYVDVLDHATLVSIPRSLGACLQPHGTAHC